MPLIWSFCCPPPSGLRNAWHRWQARRISGRRQAVPWRASSWALQPPSCWGRPERLSFRLTAAEALLRPVLRIVKATPVASFIILALVWIPSPGVPVFTSFLMVFPIVFENVLSGMRHTDRQLLEMGRMFRLSRAALFRQIYAPSLAPYLSAACATGLGLAWKAGVAAEVLANTRLSLGGKIYAAKIYLETPDLFAWTAVVIAMSVALEKLVSLALRRVLSSCQPEASHADRATSD